MVIDGTAHPWVGKFMKKTFYDLNQARSYLTDSIIRFEKKPIYVFDVLRHLNDIHIHYSPLNCMDEQVINITHKAIDLNPVELGWVNYQPPFKNEFILIRSFRKPIRAWKVGLSAENIYYEPNNGLRSINFLRSMGLYNTISNVYPSVENCLSKGNMAFSRSFAINKNKELLYLLTDEPVGKVHRSDLQLDPKYYYLSELLGKEMGRDYAA